MRKVMANIPLGATLPEITVRIVRKETPTQTARPRGTSSRFGPPFHAIVYGRRTYVS